jgi:hypothetical protein
MMKWMCMNSRRFAPRWKAVSRYVSVQKVGDKVVVALKRESRIAVLEWNVFSGAIVPVLDRLYIDTTLAGSTAGLSPVVWDQ